MLKPQIVEITDTSLGLKDGNRVFTSLEGENPGGSIKDHMVLGELQKLQKLKSMGLKGVSEVSAGSTAASLAYYCRKLGMQCVLFVPTTASAELLDGLRAQGAEIYKEELSVVYPKYDEFMKAHPELYRFNQLFDEEKRRHYHSFGDIVSRELGAVRAVIGAVGTGHSLRGIGEGIGAACPTVTAEPDDSYKIPGVRNIELNRYGDSDTLAPSYFTQRTIVPEKKVSPLKTLRTNIGEVSIGPSFALVLSAVGSYLTDKTGKTIFAVGASLRRS